MQLNKSKVDGSKHLFWLYSIALHIYIINKDVKLIIKHGWLLKILITESGRFYQWINSAQVHWWSWVQKYTLINMRDELLNVIILWLKQVAILKGILPNLGMDAHDSCILGNYDLVLSLFYLFMGQNMCYGCVKCCNLMYVSHVHALSGGMVQCILCICLAYHKALTCLIVFNLELGM